MFWVIVVAVVVIGIAFAVNQQAQLAKAKLAYTAALNALSERPNDNNRRIAALEAGRHYAELARKAAGSKGRAIFDEVALQNDMTARLGSAPAQPAVSVVERQVVVVRCRFCSKLTPVDAPMCQACGAPGFAQQ